MGISGGLLKNSYPLTSRIPMSGNNVFMVSILLKESLQMRWNSSGFNPTIVGRQNPPLPSDVVLGGKLSATTHTSHPDSRSSMACLNAHYQMPTHPSLFLILHTCDSPTTPAPTTTARGRPCSLLSSCPFRSLEATLA